MLPTINNSYFNLILPPILRIVLIGYLVLFELEYYFLSLEWSATQPLSLTAPSSLIHLVPFPLTDGELFLLKLAAKISGILAIIGFFTRPSIFIFLLIYLYLSSVDSAWGWHDHGPSLIWQILTVLVLLPATTFLSVDRFFGFCLEKASLKDFEFINSLAVILLCCLFYFASGTSKLRYSQFRWLDGKTLNYYLSGNSISSKQQLFGSSTSLPLKDKWRDGIGLTHYLYGGRTTKLGKFIAQHSLLCVLLSVVTVFGEIFMVLTLFNYTLVPLMFSMMIAFHIGIYLTMNISFASWIVLDSCIVGAGLLASLYTKIQAPPT